MDEPLTLIADSDVPDDVFERVRQQRSEKERVNLSLAVITSNNRHTWAVP